MRRGKISILIVVFLLVLSISVKAEVFEISQDVPLDKIWTVKFNKPIDINSVMESNVYIESKEASRINLEYKFKDGGDKKELEIINKDGLYHPEKEYTIHIKDVLGMDGQKLKKDYNKSFITRSKNADKKIVYINNQKDRDKYEVGVGGTLLHPFSYDEEKKQYYTYVLRGLHAGYENRKAIPYDIPEDIVFVKDLDIYNIEVEEGYLDDNEITIDDLDLYKKTEMKFTKEKPYWVEKVLFEEPQDGYDLGFYPVDYPERGLPKGQLSPQQFRYGRRGLKNTIVFSSLEGQKHIPIEDMYNNELKELKYYYNIYQNHNIQYGQTTSLETWSSPVHVIGQDADNVYYNLVNSHDVAEDGGYIYNKHSGKSKLITKGWFHFVDGEYIYYTDEKIMRVDKNGENKEVVFTKSGAMNFTTIYLDGDNIYAYNRSTPTQIWKMDKDGRNARVVIENPYYQDIKDGYQVSDGKIYFSLDDGIYESLGDGSRIRKLVGGNYDILYLLDDYLYYKKSSLIHNIDKYKIKVK